MASNELMKRIEKNKKKEDARLEELKSRCAEIAEMLDCVCNDDCDNCPMIEKCNEYSRIDKEIGDILNKRLLEYAYDCYENAINGE